MIRNFLFFSLCLLFSSAFAQEPTFTLNGQVGLMNNFSISQSSNPTLGAMKLWSCAPSFGIEGTYSPLDNWRTSIGIRYSYRSQKIVQSDFQYYLSDESFTYMRYKYENIELPLMIWRNFSSNFWVGVGASVSYFDLTLRNYGLHYRGGGGTYNGNLGIAFHYSDQPFGNWRQQTNILIGIRARPYKQNLNKFSLGILLTFRTGSMPVYYYQQILTTDDQGLIASEVYYKSTQHSADLQLCYDLFRKKRKPHR